MRPSLFSRVRALAGAHKIWTAVIVIVIVIGGYRWYRSASTANAQPEYVLAVARMGTLKQTVTGSGQVSASNQTDITSQASGAITSIRVRVGDYVSQGQLLATIDPGNAAISLQNSKLALEKLTQPAKATDISNATNSVNKSYNDAFNAVSSAYTDLPAIMSGMKDLLYSQTGFLSDQRATYLTPTARTYRDTAANAYDKANDLYVTTLAEFKGLTRSSATSSLDKLFADTYTLASTVADAVTKAQTAITFITTSQSDYDPSGASSAASSVNTWASTSNGDVSSIVSAENTISSSQNSLTTLVQGADSLDIQTAELNLEQAQRSYDDYFVRAPYDGIIGRIPVNVYGQASASTVIATIVGAQKIATISLNEVDAAKVKSGQGVAITFDAIDGLNATGTVEQVDQVGTVTQGVVTYGVKILIATADDRIKPGMSVNVTITTNEEDNVLLVPSSAVKSQGNEKYVQTFDQATVMSALKVLRGNSASTTGGFTASSTRRFDTGSTTATSTRTSFGTTTPGRYGGTGFAGGGAFGATITIPSMTPPQQTIVTIGDSDDTNTVITDGLSRGAFVVTRIITAGTAAQTSAPSIFSSLGGRGGAGARPTGGAAAGAAGGNRVIVNGRGG